MSTAFKKAEKRAVKLRAAIDGPAGSGKTLSSLKIARGIVGPQGSIALIDTEHGTAEKFYAREVEFDAAELTRNDPQAYIDLMKQARGYDCLIIDSFSHAWDGVLAMVDAHGGKFDAWRHVTPHHNALVNAVLTFPGHVIVTMRSKMAYEVDKDERGKTTVKKLGMAPVQRQGTEYELDLVMDMDQTHTLLVTKSRIRELADRVLKNPDEAFGAEIAKLIGDGAPDVEARMRELLATAGGEPKDLAEALKLAGVSSKQDLADEKKWDVAQKVAADLAAETEKAA